MAVIFLETVLAIEIMQEFQSNLVEEDSPSILKNDFSSRRDTRVMRPIKRTCHFLLQTAVSTKSNSSSEANYSCCPKLDVQSYLE